MVVSEGGVMTLLSLLLTTQLGALLHPPVGGSYETRISIPLIGSFQKNLTPSTPSQGQPTASSASSHRSTEPNLGRTRGTSLRRAEGRRIAQSARRQRPTLEVEGSCRPIIRNRFSHPRLRSTRTELFRHDADVLLEGALRGSRRARTQVCRRVVHTPSQVSAALPSFPSIVPFVQRVASLSRSQHAAGIVEGNGGEGSERRDGSQSRT